MDYIFSHRKLRIDEILQKVTTKSYFTPLKPLKSFNSKSLHKNSPGFKNKKVSSVHGSIANSPKNKEFTSVFPLLSKHTDEPETSVNSNINLEYNDPATNDSLEALKLNYNKLRYFKLGDRKLELLPKIARNKHFSLDTTSFKRKSWKKKEKSFITYIPTVLFSSQS